MIRFTCGLLATLFLGTNLCADQPIISHLFPAGGQRGTTVSFHAAGLNLNQQCDLEITGPGIEHPATVRRTSSPWFEGPVLPLPESQRQENYPRDMAAKVVIAPGVPEGDRFIFMRTSQGITQPMRFVVGSLPEIVEEEAEGDEPAREVNLPVTINGRIFPREDVDAWSVNLPAGKTITARADSQRLGYPLEAKLTLLDPKGKTVAEAVNKGNQDPSLKFVTKTAGKHTLTITDARGDGGPSFVYRLTMTDSSAPSASAESSSPLTVKQHSDNADPVRGNLLEVAGAGRGCITSPGQKDHWTLAVRRGVPIEVELKARSIGSKLLGRLSIADMTGKELATADAGTGEQLDPILKWIPPADGLYRLGVSDLFPRRGGAEFSYQLRVYSPRPDFELTLASPALSVFRGANASLKLNLRRLGGFDGPVRITIDGLPAGVTVPKELTIANGQNSLDFPFTAEKTATIKPANIVITGVAMLPLTPFTAMPLPVSHRAVWKESSEIDRLRLMVALPTPFKIAADYELKLIPRGTVYIRKFRIERNGFTGPIEIDLADNQARHLQGVTGPKITVPGTESVFDYPLTLPPYMETGRTSRTCVMGTATLREADGSEHVVNYSSREQNDQIIAVVEPERLSLRADSPTIRVEKNSSATLTVTVRRGIGLAGPIAVTAETRPGSLDSPKITVDPKNETGKLTFKAVRPVKALTAVPVLLRATIRDEQGRPVTAEQSLTVYLVP